MSYSASYRATHATSRLIATVILASLGVAGLPTPAAGQEIEWTDRQLTDFSEIVVQGRVARIVPGVDPETGAIYTYVTVAVRKVVKGWLPERRIVIKQLGGRIGDLGLVAFHQAVFTRNEDVVLFLEVRPRDGSLYPSAFAQGKWSVQRDSRGRRVAVRTGIGARARRDERRLPAFLAQIRRWAGPDGTGPSSRDVRIVTHPPETPRGRSLTSSDPVDPTDFVVWGPRWHEADSGSSVRVDVQAGGQPGLSGGGFSEISQSRDLWNNAGSSLTLSVGDERSGRCHEQSEFDGRISVSFMDPCEEMSNSGGTLASASGYVDYSDTRTINGTEFIAWVQGTTVFNDSSVALQYAQVSACFKSTVIHELGHNVGLLHSDDPGAIMYPFADDSCFSALESPAITGSLGSDDVAGLQFIYPPSDDPGDDPVPDAPTLNSPSGAISDSTPTYSWNAVSISGLNRYQVQVTASSEGDIYDEGYDPNACSGGTCELTPSTSLADGSYTWRVRARAGSTWGAWSATGSFTVEGGDGDDGDGDDDGGGDDEGDDDEGDDGNDGEAPTLISPSGTISDSTPTYTWTAVSVSGLNRYQVQVTASSAGDIYDDGYDPNACSGGTCELTPAGSLADGSYTWRVRARSGSSWGAWSATGSFTVDAGGGGDDGDPPTLIAPSGTISDSTPTYSWNAVSLAGLNRYQVQVTAADGTIVYDDGYDPNACSGGTCEVTPSTALANGDYTWHVRARSGSTWGAWSSELSFTVE